MGHLYDHQRPAIAPSRAVKRRRRYQLTPLQRTTALLRTQGALYEIVERRVRFLGKDGQPAEITRDLWGCIDILAVEPGLAGSVGIQACRTEHQAARLAKILAEPCLSAMIVWLAAGNRLRVVGWARKPHGLKMHRWSARVVEVTPAMLAEARDLPPVEVVTPAGECPFCELTLRVDEEEGFVFCPSCDYGAAIAEKEPAECPAP